jgi:hypothetical protein
MTRTTVDIFHNKQADPALDGTTPANAIKAADYNAALQADLVTLGAALGVYVTSGDPNGTLTAPRGAIARDTSLAQTWVNTSGTITGDTGTSWTPLLRADGAVPANGGAWAFLGDSNALNQGVTTDNAVRWNGVVDASNSIVPDNRGVIVLRYSVASSEPLTIVDQGTQTLRAHNASSFPGFGPELSFGEQMFDLVAGVGVTPTTGNRPLIIVDGISGVELKQALPASTYGQATPAFGGLNWYGAWKARTLSALAIAGRTLSGIVITLGGNDGSNGTDAAAVGANMQILATQIRTDFGAQVAIVWVKLHVSADTPNTATVRTQMVAGAAAIPNCRLIVIDSYPINSDNLHFKADPVWDMGLQQLEAMRQLRGIVARRVTQPTVVGYGTPDFNKAAGALTPRGYPLAKHGDVELAFVAAMKNSGSATASSGWTSSGWTLAASGAQAISGQTQEFALFTRNVLQTDLDANNGLPAAFSCTTGNDENYAVRVCVRGPNLFPTVDGSIVLYAASAFGTGGVNAVGPTTTGINSLVLTFVASQGGGASPTAHFTASNATTGAAVLIEAPLVQNTTNFGLLAVVTGVKASPSATGTVVITPSITGNPSGFTVAIKA